jgi:chromosome segregation ATPase
MLKRRVDELEPFEPEALELRLQVSKLHSLVALGSGELAQAQDQQMRTQQQLAQTQQQLAQAQDQQMRTQQQLAQTLTQLEVHLEQAKQDTARLESLRALDENTRGKVEHELSMMRTRRDELELQLEQARHKEAELQRHLGDATHADDGTRS